MTIVDMLDDSVNFVSSTASSGAYSQFTGLWTLSNLAIGDIETLTLTTETISDCGDIENTARLVTSNASGCESEQR